MTKKAKKSRLTRRYFSPRNGGRTLSKYRKDNKSSSRRATLRDAVFYIHMGQVKGVCRFRARVRKRSSRSWGPTNSAERGA